MDSKEFKASFWDHLQELRNRLLRSLVGVAIGISVAIFFSENIINYLISAVPSQALVFFSPQEGLVTLFKLSFWIGILISSPYWLFTLVRFVQPALRNNERTALPLFCILSTIFIIAGLAVALLATIPLANSYLYEFNSSVGMNLWGFASYIDYLLLLALAHGATFEIGAILLFCIHFSLIKWQTLAEKRRHAILIALIVGAILTPPDVLTQLLIAVPFYGFYELAILYGKIICLRAREPDRSYHAHQEKDATPPQAN